MALADSYPPSGAPGPTTVNILPPNTDVVVLRGTIDNARPVGGAAATVVGQGFAAGEQVLVAIRSARIELGEATAGTDGMLSLTFRVPTALRGEKSITLTGRRSGKVASIGVSFVAPPGTVQDNGATSVAVAVVGLGGLGVVLIAGGVSLLVVGRRHAWPDNLSAVAE
jgi:hypothetical protein